MANRRSARSTSRSGATDDTDVMAPSTADPRATPDTLAASRTPDPTPSKPSRARKPSLVKSRPAAPANAGTAARTRTARLRLVHVDPWSVMKTAFLLSIALGIIMIVAVTIVWGVLGAAGVWDSINSSVQKTVGSDSSTPFDITDYIGAGRVIGFTMVASVIDVVVLTALATLGAFVYNLAATLLGGVEMTYAEDR